MKLTTEPGGATLLFAAETKDDKDSLMAMLVDHMNPSVPIGAYLSIELRPDGAWHLSSQLNGRMHSSYARMTQERLLTTELPKLMAELIEDVAKLAAA